MGDTAMSDTAAKGILLEAGTNEMELLLFRVADTMFGINVAKVRELVSAVEPIEIPGTPPALDGSFRLRDEVLTLINLRRYLQMPEPEEEQQKQLIIIIEFNELRCGVLVDGVEMIHRLRWEQIEPPSEYLVRYGTPITSVARIGERVILVLDFERIVGELLGSGGTDIEPPEEVPDVPEYRDVRLLVVDDSPTIRQSLEAILNRIGFIDITLCNDGQHAWETIQEYNKTAGVNFDLVLSDIEMPRMDGLHLTARIKKEPALKHMPVILFSSLIRSETVNKGKSVGADAQVTKFRQEDLVAAIDTCLRRARKAEVAQ